MLMEHITNMIFIKSQFISFQALSKLNMNREKGGQ